MRNTTKLAFIIRTLHFTIRKYLMFDHDPPRSTSIVRLVQTCFGNERNKEHPTTPSVDSTKQVLYCCIIINRCLYYSATLLYCCILPRQYRTSYCCMHTLLHPRRYLPRYMIHATHEVTAFESISHVLI